MYDTLLQYLDHWAAECPEDTWLRDRHGDDITQWSWQTVRQQVHALAAWQEAFFDGHGAKVGILSRNCAHWFMADLGTIAAGNVTIPMFTTLPGETAEYVMDFTDMQLLFVGQTENWDQVAQVLPDGITLVTLPGAQIDLPHLTWDEIVLPKLGQSSTYQCQPDDLVSIVFTSGTTGVPKGVMQTHDSNITPINRFRDAFAVPVGDRRRGLGRPTENSFRHLRTGRALLLPGCFGGWFGMSAHLGIRRSASDGRRDRLWFSIPTHQHSS